MPIARVGADGTPDWPKSAVRAAFGVIWAIDVAQVASRWPERTRDEERQVVDMMFWGGGWSWWGWTIMSVFMVGFWALVVWAVVAFVGSFRQDAPRPPRDLDPEQILANRFARGEIDAEEYHRRLAALRAPERRGQPMAGSRR